MSRLRRKTDPVLSAASARHARGRPAIPANSGTTGWALRKLKR